MKNSQKNIRLSQELKEKLSELKEKGFDDSQSMRAGIILFHRYALNNPGEAALLAQKA
jgi:hypothetical protein